MQLLVLCLSVAPTGHDRFVARDECATIMISNDDTKTEKNTMAGLLLEEPMLSAAKFDQRLYPTYKSEAAWTSSFLLFL